MSPFLFADAILNDRPINIFNNGDMLRDFTYIDDIVEGIVRCIDKIPEPNTDWDAQNPDPSSSTSPYRIYNIGNSSPVKLMDFIQAIEIACDKVAVKNYLPMQAGDVYQTNADTSALQRDMDYKPRTMLSKGIQETIAWFKDYYQH
jgi:UDP-glucuronate 4-epimerase